jgi:drug/metabolite transporter (DMT)-like permease
MMAATPAYIYIMSIFVLKTPTSKLKLLATIIAISGTLIIILESSSSKSQAKNN